MRRLTNTPYARFYSKVALPNENGCMLWLGHLDKFGYGRFNFRGRMMTANHVSLWFADGPPPRPRMHAAHTPLVCHRPDCVAPAHLRWATGKENAADRTTDGTQCIGEKHGMARLNADVVTQIRTLYAEGGYTHPQLANQFGVDRATIGNIVRGERWRHLLDGAQ